MSKTRVVVATQVTFRSARATSTSPTFGARGTTGQTGTGFDLVPNVRLPARHGRPARHRPPRPLALGAEAGEARLRDVVTAGGLTRFCRAAETPPNLVLEARP